MGVVEDIARRKSGGDDGDGSDKEMSSYDDVEDNAADDLMDALGVDEGSREQAKSALADYVKACVTKALSDNEE
jgi:hypothetical protein